MKPIVVFFNKGVFVLFWWCLGEAFCYHGPRALWVLCESVRLLSVPFLFCFFWWFLVHSLVIIFILLSLPLIVTVFCCGCSFVSPIVWFCLCFIVFFCVIFKCFSAITFLYCIIILLSLAGVWFYTSFCESFYTFVLTLAAHVQLVTIVYVSRFKLKIKIIRRLKITNMCIGLNL